MNESPCRAFLGSRFGSPSVFGVLQIWLHHVFQNQPMTNATELVMEHLIKSIL